MAIGHNIPLRFALDKINAAHAKGYMGDDLMHALGKATFSTLFDPDRAMSTVNFHYGQQQVFRLKISDEEILSGTPDLDNTEWPQRPGAEWREQTQESGW